MPLFVHNDPFCRCSEAFEDARASTYKGRSLTPWRCVKWLDLMTGDMKKLKRIDEVLVSYPSEERKSARKMIREGVKAKEENTGDGIIKSHVQDVIVIAGTNSEGASYHCMECVTDICDHCIVARIFREGLSGKDLERNRAAPQMTRRRIDSFHDEVVELMDVAINEEWNDEWQDLDDVEYAVAAYVAADMIADVLAGVKSINKAVEMINSLESAMAEYHCCDAIYEALWECDEELNVRLKEMTAKDFANAVIEDGTEWLLDNIPDFGEEDLDYLMRKFMEYAFEIHQLKGLYFKMGLYEEFIKDSGKNTDTDDILDAALTMDALGEYDALKRVMPTLEVHIPELKKYKNLIGNMKLQDVLRKCIEDNVVKSYEDRFIPDNRT